MRCGLLGEKLGHSYSPFIHHQLGKYSYELFEKRPEELADFLTNEDFSGLNVTIPYKKAVIPYCAELTPQAKALGAVNTIVRRSDSSLLGHNTDYFGFASMLHRSGLDVAGKKVLVLGSGGASNTVVAVLKAAGAQVIVISRSGEDNYQNLHLHKDAAVIVNATPVGMYPDVAHMPLAPDQFVQLEGVLDLIYNPATTRLLRAAKEYGAKTMNGLWMLVAQAKEASECFTGTSITDTQMETVYRQVRLQMENTVLIGMPGSGKTTVGKRLAAELGKEFVDADAMICQMSGKTIPQIFAEGGEEAFRIWESSALMELGQRSGLVIATGGGCVTRAQNEIFLRQNGRIFCLQRQLDALDTSGRPLSQAEGVRKLYRERAPLYEQFADYYVDNNESLETTVANILHRLENME